MRIIEASGSSYEVGFKIGTELKETVQQHAAAVEEYIEIENRWIGTDYLSRMIDKTKEFSEDYFQEIKGLSDGLEISFERVFAWNCRGDLRWPDDISPSLAFSLSEGCTSVMMPATDINPLTIAHNEDGAAEFSDICVWVSVKPEGKPGYESFMYPGMIAGHSMGANMAGIVQTINNIRVHDLKPGVPRHVICRAILDAENLQEVTDILKGSDRAAGFHHNIGSAKEGRLLSIEAPASGCSIVEVKDAPYTHANHLIHDSEKDKEQSITRSSHVRQTRADALRLGGALKSGDPTNILFDTEQGSEILRRPIDGGDDYGQTLATGLFEMSTSKLNIKLLNGSKDNLLLSRTLDIT